MNTSKTYIKREFSNSKIDIEIKYNQSKNTVELISSVIGNSTWKGIDLLDAFNKMRAYIEDKGFLIYVNGARENSWASGFLRDSSNGLLTYIYTFENKDVVNIFDLCETRIVKYSKQRKFYDKWRKEMRKSTPPS